MFDDTFLTPIRSITCFIHKRERATHLCTDLQCVSNPVLCPVCLQDNKFRTPHITHESAIKPISEAVEILAEVIKRQIKPVQTIYEKTLGHRDNDLLRNNLEKADYLTEEVQNRINSIKMQVDLQIELLTKQFQRQMLLQKQEFFKKIDDYRKMFFSNLQILKRQSYEIMNFQTQLKFYTNPNTLLLKLSTETEKRSLDWIIQQKKTLQKITKNESSFLQVPNHSNLSTYISKINEMNMMVKPVWIGQKKELEKEKELKGWIKANFESWVSLPELKDLSRSLSHHSSSHHSSSNHEYRSVNQYSPVNLQSIYPDPNNMI